MSFVYITTLSGKESLQSFKIVVAIFSKGGVVGIRIVVWCRDCYLVRICGLVQDCRLVRVRDIYLQL